MSKRVQAVIKECRELIEKEIWFRLPEADPDSITESALAILLEAATIRCFEEQIWKTASCFTLSSSPERIATQFSASSQRLRTELAGFISFPISSFSENGIPIPTLVLNHFLITITPDEWRSEHILGWLYQYFQDTPTQKRHGQFYTSEPVADYIVSQSLNLQGFKDLEGLTILDLACGCGAFALRAFDRLYRHTQESRHSFASVQDILEHHLFLADNDPWACHIAAINLYLKAKRLEPDCHIRKLNIACGDALVRWEQEAAEDLEHHAAPFGLAHPTENRCGCANPHRAGNDRKFWGRNVQKLFSQHYDIVVGNPPYIVINQLKTPKEAVARYKLYQTAAFKINTFALFVERGLELLKPSGILGMVVPNTFLTQVYFEPLRRHILQTARIRQVLDTKRLFDCVFVENGILLLQREADEAQRSSNLIECMTHNDMRAGRPRSKRGQDGARTLERGHPARIGSRTSCPHYIPQTHFENAPLNMFHVHLDEHTLTLMEKIANGNPTFGEICESHDGVNPGNAKYKLILSEPVDTTCKKVLNGKDIARYCLEWGGLYVRYDRHVLTKGDNVRWGHRLSLDSPKIVTRQTADRLIGTYDDGTYYTTNSLHTTILRDGSSEMTLKYILALLNSKLMSFYYQNLISETGQVFSQVKLVNLRQLPLRQASQEAQIPVIAAVETLLQGMQKIPGARTNYSTVSGKSRSNVKNQQHFFSNTHTQDDEHELNSRLRQLCQLRAHDDRLDRTVYGLYGLTSEDIQRIERDMGPAVSFFPKVEPDVLAKTIPQETFLLQPVHQIYTIFQMAQAYQVHPESLLELRERYAG